MKNLIALVLFFMLPLSFFAQELTAKKITETAVAKENPQEAAEYIKSQLAAVSVPAEKRALYAFLGSLFESMALYDEAKILTPRQPVLRPEMPPVCRKNRAKCL